jgi:type I restriction enzyme S subunit
MMEILNVPKLRFPEFKDEWHDFQLIDLSLNGFSNGVFNDPKKVGKGYKLINVKDMYQGDDIDVDSLTLVDLDPKEFQHNKVEYGDIFFTRSSLVKEGIAHSSVNLTNNQDITYDGHLIKMRPQLNLVDPMFLLYLTKTKKVRNQLITRGKTTTMTTIGQNDIASVVLLLPKVEEQGKIASLLSNLNTKIQQLTRKKALLEKYKKGISQQIFNQKLSFKDDEGNDFPDWEEKRLGDIAISIKSGKTKPTLTGGFPVYGSTGRLGLFTDYTHAGAFILIARVGANAGALNIVEGQFSVTDNTIILELESKQDVTYIYNYLQILNLNKLIFGSGQPLITGGQLKALKINVPCQAEQLKAASFLASVDAKLKLVSQQLQLAQTFKKGLLQQMFI